MGQRAPALRAEVSSVECVYSVDALSSRLAKRGRARPREALGPSERCRCTPRAPNDAERAESGLQPAPSTMSENGGRRPARQPPRRAAHGIALHEIRPRASHDAGERAPHTTRNSHRRSPAMPFLPRPQKLKGMVGDKGFDPLGLSDWVPVEWLRESELKHGRVCMLAVVGFVATDLGFRLPGEMHQVASINAHDMAVDMGAMTQIGIWIAVAECIGYLAILEMLDGSGRQPGDFGFDPLQIGGANDPEMQLKELENGRLAMLAFSGIVTQAVLTDLRGLGYVTPQLAVSARLERSGGLGGVTVPRTALPSSLPAIRAARSHARGDCHGRGDSRRDYWLEPTRGRPLRCRTRRAEAFMARVC